MNMPQRQPNCIVRGSINNDEYFQVDHIARPGETLSSVGHASRIGGKGANQAVAIARAGGGAHFVGAVGTDGLWLKEKMLLEGVGVAGLVVDETVPTGRAIIQVDKDGENSIILFPGANHSLLPDQQLVENLYACTHLLLQNEIQMRSTLDALARVIPSETTVILNPSPLPSRDEVKAFPWYKVDWLIVNRSEAVELCDTVGAGADTDTAEKHGDIDPHVLLETMGCAPAFRKTNIVCTLGAGGVLARPAQVYWDSPGAEQAVNVVHVPAAALRGDVRDTTGAGDCFAGYFVKVLMDLQRGRKEGARATVIVKTLEDILRVCVVAAGMCVEKRGTIDSVPTMQEVVARMLELSNASES